MPLAPLASEYHRFTREHFLALLLELLDKCIDAVDVSFGHCPASGILKRKEGRRAGQDFGFSGATLAVAPETIMPFRVSGR